MTALAPILLLLAPLAQERVVEVQLIDNPGFEAEADGGLAGFELPGGARPIPWWRTTAGTTQRTERGFATQGAYTAEQPIAAYAPTAGEIRIEALVGGTARLRLVDGQGDRAAILSTAGPGEDSWKLLKLNGMSVLRPPTDAPELFETFEHADAPLPRLRLVLESQVPDEPAYWGDVRVFVPLPCPDEDALRAEVLEHLRWIFALWLERGLDRGGPRETGFLAGLHDVMTGEPAMALAGGPHVLFELLRDALEVEEVPAWRAAYEQFLEDWLELGFHPDTGLPVGWDCAKDVALDQSPREVHAAFGMLIDVVERGPERFRERARERALEIGEHVVAAGALPDGTVAPGYFPRDGRPNVDYPPLRRLDVPAQLARLSALERVDGERFLAPALEALLALEFTNSWPGSWDAIDPGWDDQYGHYGARSITMWRARPDVPAFARLARSGFEQYAPIWRDALRFGGNVAADQVRCWEILIELARLEPERAPEVAELLRLAIRAQFKGEQYGDGAWGDVTSYRFDPKDNLQVGDLPGVPQNLLHGLALCYDSELGLRTDELRAMFTAAMRSTAQTYRRPHGYLSTRRERAGANLAGGSVRFAVGLVEMLRQLSE